MLPILVALHSPHHDIQQLTTDGDVVAAVSSGGIVVYDADGTPLAELTDLPSRQVRHLDIDTWSATTEAGRFTWDNGWERTAQADRVGTWTFDGRVATVDGVHLKVDGVPIPLPGPPVDVTVVGNELRVATVLGAAIIGQDVTLLPIPATAAGPVWGLADGSIVDDDGQRQFAVPGAVTAILSIEDALFIGTHDGLHRYDGGLTRLDDPGPCGPFVTGVDLFQGRPAISTFQHGACTFDGTDWQRVDTPTSLTNDVAVHDDKLWIATSAGLAIHDGVETRVVSQIADDQPRSAPGTNHPGVNALSPTTGGIWVADVLGPVWVGDDGRWRRYRFGVSGHSYQSVAACEDGQVWVGSEDDGLAHRGSSLGSRNGRSRWRHVSVAHGLAEDWVMDIGCAGAGEAWVGTYRSGFGRMSAQGFEVVPGLEGAWVQAVEVTDHGLFVGTADGLFVVAEGEAAQLSQTDVHALTLADGTLWVGTRTGLEQWQL